MIKRQIYGGSKGLAGEFGHIITHPNGKECGCGQHGCYEQYASTTALVREARKIDPKFYNGRIIFEEWEKGNYVIAGGDFNHDIADSVNNFPSEQKTPSWVYQLRDADLAEGFRFVKAENAKETPTCRGADIPYEKGVTYTVIVDGFLVSDNVRAEAKNIEKDFLYSDHNPVVMEFVLSKIN